ncbi:MAG: Hpt domain-containing protein [Parvibaculum sp.]
MTTPTKPLDTSYDAILARAEAAIAGLKASYRVQLAEDIAALAAAYADLDRPEAYAGALEALASLAHNIKGQGGSFGYDLATDIGGSLSDYLRGHDVLTMRAKRIIHLHIRMLSLVYEQSLTDDGGIRGARLRAKLAWLQALG